MTISEMYLPEYDREMAKTKKILELIADQDFDYKPHQKSMALGRLASHVAEMVSWAVSVMQTEFFDLSPADMQFKPQTRQQILDSFDKNVKEVRALLADATDEELQKIWALKMEGKEVFSSPRWSVLRDVILNHMIHHRAQLGVYLRLKDIAIPGMYGPSADEMKSMELQPA